MAAEPIKIEVSRRILHIGSAAYPLQNIARVQSQELEWVRWPAIKSFLRAAVIWIVLGVAATVAVKIAARRGGSYSTIALDQNHYLSIAWGVVVALLAISAALLLFRLRGTWRQYYALVIDSAGSASAALVSPDRRLIRDLVAKITKAIENPDDPAASFSPITINNHNHIGDNINVSGSGNTGKVTI
jgi:heme/copper-type cytochrome/quinol oxidase subunit 2